MTTGDTNPGPLEGECYDPPLCDSRDCAKKGRGLHLATHEAILRCDHTSYWCDYAITYSEEYRANYRPPQQIFELLRRVFAGEYGVDGEIEMTEDMEPPIDTVAMRHQELFMPLCGCHFMAMVRVALPIGSGQ